MRNTLDTATDQEVLDLLSAELRRRLPAEVHVDLDTFVDALQRLPTGLRAMAATYQLDVSLTLDDLGWHFANWHHHGYAAETVKGLRELGATRAAELFEAAHQLARQFWQELESDDFTDWYQGSDLDVSIEPLDNEFRNLSAAAGQFGLLSLWVHYARQHPELLVGSWGRRTRR